MIRIMHRRSRFLFYFWGIDIICYNKHFLRIKPDASLPKNRCHITPLHPHNSLFPRWPLLRGSTLVEFVLIIVLCFWLFRDGSQTCFRRCQVVTLKSRMYLRGQYGYGGSCPYVHCHMKFSWNSFPCHH